MCPNHCHKFALSDKQDPHFHEICLHQYSETCGYCEKLKMFMMKKKFKLEALPGTLTARTNISLQLQVGMHKYISLESSHRQIS